VTVWVIEADEYEEKHIYGVADSLEAAVAYVKAKYQPEGATDLQWGPVESYNEQSRYIEATYTLRRLFTNRYQQYVECFDLTPYEVATA
jgi:hypothetical protein